MKIHAPRRLAPEILEHIQGALNPLPAAKPPVDRVPIVVPPLPILPPFIIRVSGTSGR